MNPDGYKKKKETLPEMEVNEKSSLKSKEKEEGKE